MRVPEQLKPVYIANKQAFMGGLAPALDYGFGLPYKQPKDPAELAVFETMKHCIDYDRERTAELRAQRQKRWNAVYGNREA